MYAKGFFLLGGTFLSPRSFPTVAFTATFLQESRRYQEANVDYPPGNQHIPPGEKENHLQNAMFGGYVSSLESSQATQIFITESNGTLKLGVEGWEFQQAVFVVIKGSKYTFLMVHSPRKTR